MTVFFIQTILVTILCIYSTLTFAQTESATVIQNDGPGTSIKATNGDIDKTVTILTHTQVGILSESSKPNDGWTPSTISLPQTSESSQLNTGWTPSTISLPLTGYREVTTEENTHENRSSDVSPAYVEELINSTRTRAFLNSITNDVKRLVITEQLRHCPYSKLCTFSFNLSLPHDNVSACANCSCTNNSKFNLCPDILDFVSFGIIRSEPFDCFSMYLKPLKDEPLNSEKPKYKAIYKCVGDDTRMDSCISMEEDKSFADILPVTDKNTNITYINAACAVCNNINDDNLVLWNLEMACEEREIQVYRTEEELIKFYEDRSSCNMKYSIGQKQGVKPEVCPHVIRKCNESGQWKTFDPFISSACGFYENRYSIEVKVGTPRFIFRNIFCALCNGVVPSVYTIFAYEKRWLSPSDIYSFSGLINFGKPDELVIKSEAGCETGLIFDVVRKKCVKLLCAPLRHLQGDKCEPIYNEVAGVVYIFTALLYPTEPQQMVIEPFILEPFEHFFRDTFFQGFLIDNHPYSEHTAFCGRRIETVTSSVCKSTSVLSMDCFLKVDYYEIELNIAITQFHSFTEILDRYHNMTISQPIFMVPFGDSVFHFLIKPTQLQNSLCDLYIQSECPPKAERINLARQALCPLVELASDDYKWFEEDGYIFFNSSHNVMLNESQMNFNSNRTSISICSDVYTKYFLAMIPAETQYDNLTFEAVVSLACVSLSILSLLISFATFCIHSSLRTLPGKNNMALVICLLCAQLLFLVGSFSHFEQNSTVCIAVGVLTHFFWLMSIFWMNVCTVHVFRVFIGTGDFASSRGVKTLLIYWAYTIILSATFVLVNVFISLSNSSYSEIGYGAQSCYINSEKMVGLTFGLPVGCVIITNLVLFCSVVRKIIMMPEIQKDVRHERNDVVIFAKLSSLTGFCWIFGLVYSWSGIQAFSYLFIVLNASQGVFIFLSFVCTKRVIKMYKDNVSAILTKAVSFRTKTTDSGSDGQKYISHSIK